MRRTLRITAALLALIVLFALPFAGHASSAPVTTPLPGGTSQPTEAKPSANMLKSEKLIADILSAETLEDQQEQFVAMVQPRLKYATARSLCGKTESWLAFVDVYELYKNGKATGYKIQQATLQYGVYSRPPLPVGCTLSIGKYTSAIEESSKSIYIFPNEVLEKDAQAGPIDISITDAEGSTVSVALKENLPGSVAAKEDAMTALTEAYVEYAAKQTQADLIDHAYMRLRSHVTNTQKMAMHYSWELFLVHNSELPAQATLLKYDLQSGDVEVSRVEIKS